MERHSAGSFAELLKRYRLAAGLTQEELAARAQASPRGVSDLERGKRTKPHLPTVRALADAMALSEADRAGFLTAAQGTGSPVPTPESASSPPEVPTAPTHSV